MKFTLDKTSKKRLATFNDVSKKIEAFCPLDDKQLFYLNADKSLLEVYSLGSSSAGGAGIANIMIDVKFDPITVDTAFVASLASITTAMNKIKGDTIQFDSSQEKVVLNNPDKPKSSISISLSPSFEPDAITETRDFIRDRFMGATFQKDYVEVLLTPENKSIIEAACATTAILDVNDSIELDVNEMRAADNLCISRIKVPKASIVSEKILFNRNIASILKSINAIRVSSDKKYFYLDLKNDGIEVLFQPKMPRYQFPTTKEIESICPVAESCLTLEVGASGLFESLDQFKGMFPSNNWRYEQVRFNPTKGEDLHLYFDDMATAVDEYVPVLSESTTLDDDEPFEFIMPTLQLKSLQALFDDTITFHVNNLDSEDVHGAAIIIASGKLNLVLGKVLA